MARGTPWGLEGPVSREAFPRIAARLLGQTFLVAAAIVDEKVGTIEDVDIGARVGLRWPLGPFELMNKTGLAEAARLAAAALMKTAGETDYSGPLSRSRTPPHTSGKSTK